MIPWATTTATTLGYQILDLMCEPTFYRNKIYWKENVPLRQGWEGMQKKKKGFVLPLALAEERILRFGKSFAFQSNCNPQSRQTNTAQLQTPQKQWPRSGPGVRMRAQLGEGFWRLPEMLWCWFCWFCQGLLTASHGRAVPASPCSTAQGLGVPTCAPPNLPFPCPNHNPCSILAPRVTHSSRSVHAHMEIRAWNKLLRINHQNSHRPGVGRDSPGSHTSFLRIYFKIFHNKITNFWEMEEPVQQQTAFSRTTTYPCHILWGGEEKKKKKRQEASRHE